MGDRLVTGLLNIWGDGRLNGSTYSAISAAAVAAAEAEAQAAELEQRATAACRRPYLSSFLRRPGSISPASSDLSTCSSANRVNARLVNSVKPVHKPGNLFQKTVPAL